MLSLSNSELQIPEAANSQPQSYDIQSQVTGVNFQV